jgi:hypothetical protein
MEDFVKQLTDDWKTTIESIDVDGHSKKIESIYFFRMDKYYTGYPDIEHCYKVTFTFTSAKFADPYFDRRVDQPTPNQKWHLELKKTFTKILGKPNRPLSGEHLSWSDQIHFKNDRTDYMRDQGYRFIVQFYPKTFLTLYRDQKLETLGI